MSKVWRPQKSTAALRAIRRHVSMPGMMETVLNLGLNDEIVEGLVEKSHLRFVTMCIAALSKCTATSLWAFAPRVSRLIPSSS